MYKSLLVFVFALLVTNIAHAQWQWSVVGTAAFSDTSVSYPNLAIDKDGRPIVCYSDHSRGGKATVMRFNGSSWVPVGIKGLSDSTALYTDLAVDGNNIPYLIYRDYSTAFYDATVMKFDGTKWNPVGGKGIAPGGGSTHNHSIALDSKGRPYVYFRDNRPYAGASVLYYNGSQWVDIPLVKTNPIYGDPYYMHVDLGEADTPYICYTRWDGSVDDRMVVKKYNGSNWQIVGWDGVSKPGIGLLDAFYTSFAFDSKHTPYVSGVGYYAKKEMAFVMKYDGKDWVYVGGYTVSSDEAKYTSLATDSRDQPYIVYRDSAANNKATVMMYNGVIWTPLGTGISTGRVIDNRIAINKYDAVYVSFIDEANNNKITVMKYDCVYAPQQVAICAVYTDSALGKNKIVWDTTGLRHVDNYKIYRENFGAYQLLGVVSGSSVGEYIDQVSTPATKSYQYKITVLDSCGRETPIDDVVAHKSILLTFKSLLNNANTIAWNTYVGKQGLSYIIMRNTNGTGFLPVDTVVVHGTDTTYVDANVPTGINEYRIEVLSNNNCISSTQNITSNIVAAWPTGIATVSKQYGLSLTPNPATQEVQLSFGAQQAYAQLKVLNATGQFVYQQSISMEKGTFDLLLKELPKGVYIVMLESEGAFYYEKLLVQ